MNLLWSVRHSNDILGLRESGKLQFTERLRGSIRQILEAHPQFGFDETGWQGNVAETGTHRRLCIFYGEDPLRSQPNGDIVDVYTLIQRGWPSRVLDAIEAWMEQVPSEEIRQVETELNDVFLANRSPWRVINGKVLLLDEQYATNEVRAAVRELLAGETGCPGAASEFSDAQIALDAGNSRLAIERAFQSVESSIKCVLNDDKVIFKDGIKQLMSSGIIPAYYERFFLHFEQLLLGFASERNQPGRAHGGGGGVSTPDEKAARLVVNIAGALNVFLMEISPRAMREVDLTAEPELGLNPEDLPFE